MELDKGFLLKEIPLFEGLRVDDGPERPEIRWIDVDKLYVNEAYQRDILKTGLKVIRSISKDFHWARFGIVTVMDMEDGRFSVLDGQHRCAAIKSMGADAVPCLVVPKADLQAQAAHFIGINSTRTAMTPVAQFKARLMAGEPGALSLFAFIEDCGVIPLLYQPNPKFVKKPSITAYAAIERIHRDSLVRPRLKRAMQIAAGCGKPLIGGRFVRIIYVYLGDISLAVDLSDEQISEALRLARPSYVERLVKEHREATGDTIGDSAALVIWRILIKFIEDTKGSVNGPLLAN